MKHLAVAFLFLFSTALYGQLSIVSTSPADNSVGVGLSTTVSVTFSSALDAAWGLANDHGLFTNLDSIASTSLSGDLRTLSFNVTLSADKVYFVCVYAAKSQGGEWLPAPAAFTFTTGSAFPLYTVSGNVNAGSTGTSPARSLVILSTTPLSSGKPEAASGSIADLSGNFTIPYLGNGTYYPIAAKDLNNDGSIDPSQGDAIGFADPVQVNNGNISGISITLTKTEPMTFVSAVHIADSISALLPPGKTLREVSSWSIDTLGRGDRWRFSYIANSGTEGYEIEVDPFGSATPQMEQNQLSWMLSWHPITNLQNAAVAGTVIANVEAAGGALYRHQPPTDTSQFRAEMALGDVGKADFYSLIPDTSKNYWGVTYTFGREIPQQWITHSRKQFVCDFNTGAVLVVAGVYTPGESLPGEVVLHQNYPNPFNPTTRIAFSIPRTQEITLVVHNLLGQEISTLVRGIVPAGEHIVTFDAGALPAGVYFYKLSSAERQTVNKMVLVK